MPNIPFTFVLVLLSSSLSLALSTCVQNQTDLASYLQSHRPFLLDLLCRGFPVHLSVPLYKHSLTSLFSPILSTSPDTPLEQLCTPTPPPDPGSLINIPTLNNTLTKLLSEHPSLSYLPRSHFPQLPNLDQSLLSPITKLNENVKESLHGATPASLNQAPLLHFPPPMPYLVDPLHPKVCQHYQSFNSAGTAAIPAPDLLHQVVALVLQLHFLSIPPLSSLPLLYHNLAFTFLAIRCTKTESHKLHLPAVFLPWYQQAYDSLISSFSQKAIPPVTPTLVRETLGPKLQIFATHAAWGHPNLLVVKNGIVQTESISNIIFHPRTLEHIQKLLCKLPASANWSLSSRTLSTLSLRLSCRPGLDSYSSPPRIPKAICCPGLCRQMHLLAKVKWNTETCCFEYARNPNSLLQGPLRDAATIYLEPYPPGSSGTTKVKI